MIMSSEKQIRVRLQMKHFDNIKQNQTTWVLIKKSEFETIKDFGCFVAKRFALKLPVKLWMKKVEIMKDEGIEFIRENDQIVVTPGDCESVEKGRPSSTSSLPSKTQLSATKKAKKSPAQSLPSSKTPSKASAISINVSNIKKEKKSPQSSPPLIEKAKTTPSVSPWNIANAKQKPLKNVSKSKSSANKGEMKEKKKKTSVSSAPYKPRPKSRQKQIVSSPVVPKPAPITLSSIPSTSSSCPPPKKPSSANSSRKRKSTKKKRLVPYEKKAHMSISTPVVWIDKIMDEDLLARYRAYKLKKSQINDNNDKNVSHIPVVQAKHLNAIKKTKALKEETEKKEETIVSEIEEVEKDEEEEEISNEPNFQLCEPLVGIPKIGDSIAFKTLLPASERVSCCLYEVSDYLEGAVVEYHDQSSIIDILIYKSDQRELIMTSPTFINKHHQLGFPVCTLNYESLYDKKIVTRSDH